MKINWSKFLFRKNEEICKIHAIQEYVFPGKCDNAKKMKFSIMGFFSKCDQIRQNLRTWSHLLKKFLMENFDFCAA